jgi:hypothetical protein
MLAVFPLRLLTGNAARAQNGSASTGKLNQSIVRCGNRSNETRAGGRKFRLCKSERVFSSSRFSFCACGATEIAPPQNNIEIRFFRGLEGRFCGKSRALSG